MSCASTSTACGPPCSRRTRRSGPSGPAAQPPGAGALVAFAFGGGDDLVRREADGSFTVHLSEPEQLLIKSLLAQLRTLLKVEGSGEITEDSGVRRLFPPAYPG